MAHDLWSNVVRKGRDSEKEEVVVAKVAAAGIGIARDPRRRGRAARASTSPSLVGLAFCVAASANFPALLLALFWRALQHRRRRRRHHLRRLISSLFFIVMSPPVWPGADSETGSPLGSLGPGQPGDLLHPDRLPRLLAGHGAELGGDHRAQLRRAVRARRDGPRRRGRPPNRLAPARSAGRWAPAPRERGRRAHPRARRDQHDQPARRRGRPRPARRRAAGGGRVRRSTPTSWRRAAPGWSRARPAPPSARRCA